MEQTRQIKQFQFYDFYAEIISGLNDESAGRIVRLMCEYMFTDNAVAELKTTKSGFIGAISLTYYRKVKRTKLKANNQRG